MNEFLLGGTAIACWTVGLFFLRFWQQTHDRLLAIFAMSFFLLGLIRLGLAIIGPVPASHTLHLLRLAAYLLIVAAIIDKNRFDKWTS